MKAVVYEGVGRVAVGEVPDPAIEDPHDAIVRVAMAAICGSDLHFLHGKAPLDPGETMGHEAVGIVDQAGPDVKRFRPGERVVVAFNIACGECWFCRHGQTQLCEDFRNLGAGVFGGGLGGAQAELVRVPHSDVNLLSVPGDVEDERALFVGDVLTTGWYAVANSGADKGDLVAVVGVGPVGYFCIRAALAQGVRRVLALDREPHRLDLAAAAGAEPVDVRRRHPHTAAAEASGGRGADVVIEAVGTREAFETAVDVVRRGGEVTVVGMYAGESVDISLGVYWSRALRLSFTGVCPVHAWWERTMAAVRERTIDPLPLISHRMRLEEAAEGYRLFDERRATKVVLKP